MEDTTIEEAKHCFYDVLNVSCEASQEELRSAFMRLSRIFHPDRVDTELKKAANDQFSTIDEAYKVLSDPILRTAYDEYGYEGVKLIKARQKSQTDIFLYSAESEMMKKEVFRMLKQRSQAIREVQAAFSSTTFIKINATSWIDGETPDFALVLTQQAMEAPLSTKKDINLTISSTVLSQPGNRGLFGVGVSTQYNPSSDMLIQLMLSTGLNSIQLLSFRQKLGNDFFGTMKLTYKDGNPGIGVEFGSSLGKHTTGRGSVSAGSDGGIEFQLRRNGEKYSLDGTLNVGLDPSTSGISTSISKKLSNSMIFKTSGQLNLSGVRLSILYSCPFGDPLSKSSISCAILLANSSLIFEIRYTRGNVRMVVPIQLSAGLVYLPSFFLASALETLFLQITGFLRRRKEKKNKLKSHSPRDGRFQRLVQICNAQKSAESHRNMILQPVAASVSRERENSGLLILEAWYGDVGGSTCQAHSEYNEDLRVDRGQRHLPLVIEDFSGTRLTLLPVTLHQLVKSVKYELMLRLYGIDRAREMLRSEWGALFLALPSGMILNDESTMEELGIVTEALLERSRTENLSESNQTPRLLWLCVPKRLDVKDILQFLVKDSQLILQARSKAGLLGFYNPSVDSKSVPRLYIRYNFSGRIYELTIQDQEAVILPSNRALLIGEERIILQ